MVSLAPLLSASWAVQLHVATVVPAAVIGVWLIVFSGKGSVAHRKWGVTYMVLMVVTACVALFIHETNPRGFMGFSFIHLFVPITWISVVMAWRAARRGDVARHKAAVIGSYVGGILIAGGLTFLPGRVMYHMFTGG